MIACIDGGIFCVGIPALIVIAFPWLARKLWKVCKKSCGCKCHDQKAKHHRIWSDL
jgi:hypothetical protein